MPFKNVELVFIAFAFLVCDGASKFRNDVSADFDHCLVERVDFHGIEELDGSIFLKLKIWLSFSKTCDNLRNSKPKVLVDIVSSEFDKFDNDIYVPIEIFCELFR